MNIKSMTGFGKGKARSERFQASVSIRSLNHRYLELRIEIDSVYAALEPVLRKRLEANLHRGKVDVHIELKPLQSDLYKVEVFHPLAKAWAQAIEELRDSLGVEGDVSPCEWIRMSDLVRIEPESSAFGDEDMALLDEALQKAIDETLAMKKQEGANLGREFNARLDTLHSLVSEIENSESLDLKAYTGKLQKRMKELLNGTGVVADPDRILQEAALLASRSDVSEEIERLKSHFEQFHLYLEKEESVGKTLDFLTQEMQREANTLSVKVRSNTLATTAVELKSELEKLREQVRNVE